MAIQFEAFTSRYKGRSQQILTKCHVCEGFDPTTNGPEPKIMEFVGLWDTGAFQTVISPKIATSLGLVPTGKVTMIHADGPAQVDTYLINIVLPNGVGFPLVDVMCSNLSGTDMLIGMDLISLGDFSITNVGGKTTFSFRHPSIEEVDYVRKYHAKHIGANDKCPCGSGKKYKRCHGTSK